MCTHESMVAVRAWPDRPRDQSAEFIFFVSLIDIAGNWSPKTGRAGTNPLGYTCSAVAPC
jgi:hypothetical protein